MSGSDVDGDALTYSIVSNPSNGSLEITSDKYLSFDGENDYITIPGSDSYDNLGDFSFSVWIKIPEDLSVSNGKSICN